MSKRFFVRLVRILVITFPILAGIFATLYGLYLYNQTQIFNLGWRGVPSGFLVFSSMELSSVDLSVVIMDVNFEKSLSDKAGIICSFDLASSLTNDQTIGFQIPYVVENIIWIESEFDMVSEGEIVRETVPATGGGQQTDVTIVYFRFRPNPNILHYSFSVWYNWSGFLSKTEYATYKLVVPFARDERSLHESISSLLPDAKIRYITRSESDHASILVNAAAHIKEAYPTPSRVMGMTGYDISMVMWDLNYQGSILESRMQPLYEVVVYFELSSEVAQRDRYIYESGIYTGLGVSLLFSGIHEALKALEESKKPRSIEKSN